MSEALASAVAIAASPFSIIPAVLLLFTPRALPTGFSFLVGWSTGIAASATAFALLAEVVEQNDTTPTWASWARIVLGAVLIAVGARGWMRRGEESEPPPWIESIASSTPRSALRLGLLLSAANPKVLLLAAAAGLAIGSEDLTTSEVVTSLALFTVVAAVTVAAPPLLYLVAGRRVLAPLGRVKDWLVAHSAAVMAVVITAIGIALLAKGIATL
jgi:threonine/homoserine/homoserine lactone efflux protein